MLITHSYQESNRLSDPLRRYGRTLRRNDHDKTWNYTIYMEFCWKWRKHYRKVPGSLRRAAVGVPSGGLGPAPPSRPVCKLNVIKIIISYEPSRNAAWRIRTNRPSLSRTLRDARTAGKRAQHHRKCKWLTTDAFLLFRIVFPIITQTIPP